MCTVLLSPGVNPTAVNKYVMYNKLFDGHTNQAKSCKTFLIFTYLLTYLLTHSLTHSLHTAQSFLRSQPVCSYPSNSPYFMEPEGSLPHLQVPATCLYPEPAQSVHTPTSHLLKICLNIILPSTPWSPQWSLPLIFSHLSSPFLIRATCPCPSHFSRFNHPHSSGWGVHIIKLFNMKVSSLPCYLVSLRPKYSPQQPIIKFSNTLSLRSSLQRPSFTPIQKFLSHY
jgi:hypothetical protein